MRNIASNPFRSKSLPIRKAIAVLLVAIGSIWPSMSSADEESNSRVRRDNPQDHVEFPEEMDDSDETEEPIVTEKIKQASNKRPPMYVEEEEDESTQITAGDELGVIGRLSHMAGKTFGRNDSITPLEVMPYKLTDEHFLFSDIRGFVTNGSQVGGNFGVGYRRLFEESNAWAGASLWYDADQSTSKLFQQIGLSFEGLIQQFEFRSNLYLPFSSSQTFSNSIGEASIVGNQLLYNRLNNVGSPMRGFDAEIGYSYPILDRHVARGFVGGYHFEGGSASNINGFKLRFEGVINNTVTAHLLYTHDNQFGDNFMAGVSMQFPFGDNHPTSFWTRNTPSPYRYVERNYNVIVGQSQTSSGTNLAVNPTTNNPYVVEQVYSPPSGSVSGTQNGSSTNPFSSVAAAQAAGGNLIFVQSGSVLNQPITLASGQHLLGAGTYSETIATQNGNLQIPNLIQALQPNGIGSIPTIQNVSGNAVTLASNTEVAGFNITGATGNAIVGNGISTTSLHDLTLISNVGSSISLTNSTGNIAINNTQITSTSTSPDISIVNSSGNTTLGNLAINTQNGTGLYASNVSNLQVNGGKITAVNAPAIDIESSAAKVSLDSVSANGGAYGIIIQGSTGSFTMPGTGSKASGGTIQNTTSAGVLINSFGNTTLNWMNFVNNHIAIQSTGSAALSLSELQISGSTGYALSSLNDGNLALTNSTLTTNGSSGSGSISIQANTTGTYNSIFTGNTITDSNGTAIQFLTQPGGAGASLNTEITSNTISGYNNGSSLISGNWNGPVIAAINSNTMNAYGANMKAVSFQTPSTTATISETIDSNTITFENASSTGGTGIWITDGQSGQSATGTLTLGVQSNAFVFHGTGGTGLRFGAYRASIDTITANSVNDQAGGATGMLFDSIASNSTLIFGSNAINLLATDTTTHSGFIFTQVSPNVTFSTVTGSVSNNVSNPSSGKALVIPSGTGIGGIIINGNLILLPK